MREERAERPGRFSGFMGGVRLIFDAGLFALVLFFIGFIVFANGIEREQQGPLRPADGIAVLTGGVSRIAQVLQRVEPDVVVIELGANDGLRGLPLAQSRDNLQRMVQASRRAGAKVLLVGMRMPPNLGKRYTEGFAANYRAVAQAEGVALLPFLLEPVAADRASFQDDNLHPTAAAQPRLLDHVWTSLEPLLD